MQTLGSRRSMSGLTVKARTFYGEHQTPADDGGSERESDDGDGVRRSDDGDGVRRSPRKKKRTDQETVNLPIPPAPTSKQNSTPLKRGMEKARKIAQPPSPRKPAPEMGTPPPRQSSTPQWSSTPRPNSK